MFRTEAWLLIAAVAACGGDEDSSGSGTGASGGTGASTPTSSTTGGGSSFVCGARDMAEENAALDLSPLLFWTSLDDAEAVTTPAMGSGPGSSMGEFVASPSNGGIQIDQANEHVSYPQAAGTARNVVPTSGTFDFCFQPAASHDDGARHVFLSVPFQGGILRFEKDAANALAFEVATETESGRWEVPGSAYALAAGGWYRVTVAWMTNTGQPSALFYLDGAELAAEAPAMVPFVTAVADMPFLLGNDGTSSDAGLLFAGGVLDEAAIYNQPLVP
jgi:concanavalin A-like lectin/glucanase superfamily protein